MSTIHILDQNTIDKIAAGEVVERPASIVKELTENAIDAGASHITVEIQGGGISMIRVSDDGKGIPSDEIRLAFTRHATSKISSVEDLNTILSLGFRGEALSSIAAVGRIELITKAADELTAVRYVVEGGREKLFEEIGAPDGTTIIVRDIFYNTPARAKFLKTAMTEASHVGSYVEQLALSHPDIGFEYIVNGTSRLHTTGNGNLKDAVYHIYGRELAAQLLPVDYEEEGLRIDGFIAKPCVSRGNRNFENYYVNGRYVKSRVISLGIEEGYGSKLMQHQYPFTCLSINISGDLVDVNVHPTKMDVRFSDERKVMQSVAECIKGVLYRQDMIIRSSLNPPEKKSVKDGRPREKYAAPTPFEKNALRESQAAGEYSDNALRVTPRATADPGPAGDLNHAASGGTSRAFAASGSAGNPGDAASEGMSPAPAAPKTAPAPENPKADVSSEVLKIPDKPAMPSDAERKADKPEMPSDGERKADKPEMPPDGERKADKPDMPPDGERKPDSSAMPPDRERKPSEKTVYEQQELPNMQPTFLSPEAKPNRRILGCAFRTYWIVEYGENLYMIDQHAAHEKVLFTRFMKEYENSSVSSQQLSPPIVISLDSISQALLAEYMPVFTKAGFEIESFGGNDVKISAVPYQLSALGSGKLFLEMLDHLEISTDPKKLMIYEHRVATEACKAAVKGGDRISLREAEALIDELFECEDPYHCPHGRPTIISFTKKDLEKRFKRIV